MMDRINNWVEILCGEYGRDSATALLGLVDEVKNATTSLTSIPKPLKFINPHFEKIEDFYKKF